MRFSAKFLPDSVVPNLNTGDAMARLKQFSSSLGRYGSTPYLVPLYGSGELSQAYCRY